MSQNCYNIKGSLYGDVLRLIVGGYKKKNRNLDNKITGEKSILK